MKILFFSQFYKPEYIAPSFRATDNAEAWVKTGHEVAVFTAYPNYPTGKVFQGYKVSLLQKQTIEKVKVFRSKLIIKPNTSMFYRLENGLSFLCFGLYNVLFKTKVIGKDYDIVLGTSGTIFTAMLAWVYAALYSKPFVFELRDITYKALVATGRKENSIAVRGMKFLELFLCKRAKKVVVVTNGFKKILAEAGIVPEKIHVITNGVDASIVEKKKSAKLVLSYYGNLGISQDIVNTFSYAEAIKNNIPAFQYLIIGEGAQKQLIKDAIVKDDKKYINLLDGMSSNELEEYYGLTYLSIVTLRKSHAFKYTIPSKLFQIMGRGIAVLYIGPNGEAADIIRQYKAGIVLTDSLDKDVAVLNQFFAQKNWKELLEEMGRNGAAAVSENYSRKKLAADYLAILEAALMK